MPLHLVSRRFLFSPLLLRPFCLNTGTPRFKAHNYRSTSEIVDIYYDTSTYQLASNEISLRTRNGIWQLKQRVPFSHKPQTTDHFHEKNHLSTRVWKELTDRREIMIFMEGLLGKDAMMMMNDDGRKEGVVGRTLTFNFGMKVISELKMTRISYVLDNKWMVNLDRVKGSGYQVGKVEAELGVGSGGEKVVGMAREKVEEIEDMMDKYRWFFREVPDPADGVKGKMCAWFEKPGIIGKGTE